MTSRDSDRGGQSRTTGKSQATRSGYDDPQAKIWSIYVSEAEKFDRALAESWKGDMDGILIFSGLFSASVTAFIVEGYKDLKPDHGEMTVALLVQISEHLGAGSNNNPPTNVTIPLVPHATPGNGVRVNAFWFLSLFFSLSCALMATLVQQWARQYLQAVERRPAPHDRARIRSFLHEGLIIFNMTAMVDAIPTLLHIAVFLFFAGLVEFLYAVNLDIARMSLGVVTISGAVYLSTSILPTIIRNCPYRTPLSSVLLGIVRLLRLLFFRSFLRDNPDSIRGSMAQGRTMLALQESPGRQKRDVEALRWTLESLTDNSELEEFVEGIPAFLGANRKEQFDDGHEPSSGEHIVMELLRNKDISLGPRIARLLQSCEPSQAISIPDRRKRAIISMQAIFAITTLVKSESWSCLISQPSFNLKGIVDGADREILAHYANVIWYLSGDRITKDLLLSLSSDHDRTSGPLTPEEVVYLKCSSRMGLLRFLANEVSMYLPASPLPGLDHIARQLSFGLRGGDKFLQLSHKARNYHLTCFLKKMYKLGRVPPEAYIAVQGAIRILTSLPASYADTQLQIDLVHSLFLPVIGQHDGQPALQSIIPEDILVELLQFLRTLTKLDAIREALKMYDVYISLTDQVGEPGRQASSRLQTIFDELERRPGVHDN